MRPIATWRAWRNHGRRDRDPRVEASGLAPADTAELDERFALVEASFGADRDAQVAVRLQPLVARRVPARVVEAVPALPAARVRFADGTAVFVKGTAPGDVAVLATWIRARSVLPAACSTTEEGTHLVFRSSTSSRALCLRVTGVDQPS